MSSCPFYGTVSGKLGVLRALRGHIGMQQRRSSQSFKRKELVSKLDPTLSARLPGSSGRRQAARQPLCRAGALHRAAGDVRALRRADDPGRCRGRREPDGGRPDARHRQAAARRHLHRGVLGPYLPCHPGGLESRRARIPRAGGPERPYPARLPQGSGPGRAGGQDQRRIRQGRRRRRRLALRRGGGRLAGGRRRHSRRCWGSRGAAQAGAGRRLRRWRNMRPTSPSGRATARSIR